MVAPERLGGFYSCSVFKSLSVIGLCQANTNVPASKIDAHFIWAPRSSEMAILSKTARTLFIQFH